MFFLKRETDEIERQMRYKRILLNLKERISDIMDIHFGQKAAPGVFGDDNTNAADDDLVRIQKRKSASFITEDALFNGIKCFPYPLTAPAIRLF